MKPVDFKHRNVNFAEKQPQYGTLPALKIPGEQGAVITCWRLSFKERIKLIFTGHIWMNLLSFNNPLTPSKLSTSRKELFYVPADDLPFYKRSIEWWKYQFKLLKNYFKVINDRAKEKLNNVFK